MILTSFSSKYYRICNNIRLNDFYYIRNFKLKNKGNSIFVIEHSLEVISASDYIIDLGPSGGNEGGNIISYGSVEEIIKKGEGYTGDYLREFISQ